MSRQGRQQAGHPGPVRVLHPAASRDEAGVVLLITLVVLIVLASLGYTVASRVAAQRHRDNYLIDYQSARYACDSALKYALGSLQDLNDLKLVERPNEPDFSDLFAMEEDDYQLLLEQWAEEKALLDEIARREAGERDLPAESNTVDTEPETTLAENLAEISSLLTSLGANDVNFDVNMTSESEFDANEANEVVIRGPYGPEWPFVTEPVEFEIGSAKITIEIEDENAKFPLGWAALEDRDFDREPEASFETFCEWMRLDFSEIDMLKEQARDLAELRPFRVNFQPITIRTAENPAAAAPGTRRTARTTRTRYKTETIAPTAQFIRQGRDYAKLLHSSVIDRDLLARPYLESETRKESALKYCGIWGTAKVNVNTAPRHVLEALFTFGGNATNVAEAIIQARRIKPFKDFAQLRQDLFRYSDSISKCENLIVTSSDSFTVRVTAQSGVARVTAVAAVTRNGNTLERVAVLSD